MVKDKYMWKGRAISDKEKVAEREEEKRQALQLKLLNQQTRAMKKFHAQKRKGRFDSENWRKMV